MKGELGWHSGAVTDGVGHPHRLAIFGPVPPPRTGMEEFTLTLLELLKDREHNLEWTHVDTAISRGLDERGRFRVHKLRRLAQQTAVSAKLAAEGYDAYVQISQNRVGLIRDLCLLLPFRINRRRMIVHLHGGLLDAYLRDEAKVLALLLRWTLKDRRNRGIVLTQSLRHCLRPLLPADRITPVPKRPTFPAGRGRRPTAEPCASSTSVHS